MIISASRRTDIPAFYSVWLFRRIIEGYALVRNPMNHRQVSCVGLTPADVDCMVFWSKNPAPMLPQLDALKDYMYYFLFTLNAYEDDIETRLPSLRERINIFRRLIDRIGPERVIWRYSPILANNRYTAAWHGDAFGRLAEQLKGYTHKCVFSFIDFYAKIKHSVAELSIEKIAATEKYRLAGMLAQSAMAVGMTIEVDTCKENLDFTPLGIKPARCIDGDLIAKLTDKPLIFKKDPGQPSCCNCAISVDIGAYSTCNNGCRYCYANSGVKVQPLKRGQCNVNSPMLCGNIEQGDIIKNRNINAAGKVQMIQLKLPVVQ